MIPWYVIPACILSFTGGGIVALFVFILAAGSTGPATPLPTTHPERSAAGSEPDWETGE